MTAPPSGEVTISGRTFTLGTVYEPAPHVRPYEQGRLLPLRLVGYDPTYPWPAGRAGRGRAGPVHRSPADAEATIVRPGVGVVGGRAGCGRPRGRRGGLGRGGGRGGAGGGGGPAGGAWGGGRARGGAGGAARGR